MEIVLVDSENVASPTSAWWIGSQEAVGRTLSKVLKLVSGNHWCSRACQSEQAAISTARRRHWERTSDVDRRAARAVRFQAFILDDDRFLQNLRTSRRGVAAGPSGMNSDHLFRLLDSERDSMKFYEFASLLARGEVPGEVMEILRMGRITALSKPDGGVRGITVGDILRRLVARTVAAVQQES